MLTAPTLDKLQQLKLDAMAHAWSEQHQQAAMSGLAFDECQWSPNNPHLWSSKSPHPS